MDAPVVAGLAQNTWDQSKLTQRYPALDRDISADAVIVGAGVAGLTVAYDLAKAGKKVVVLESRVRGAGHTGRDTGEMSLLNSDLYSTLERWYGLEVAAEVAASHMAAVDHVEQIVKAEGIKCGFERVPSYLFGASRGFNDSTELGALHRIGLKSAKQVDLRGDATAGGVRTALEVPGGAVLNPVQYVDKLAEAIVKAGGQVFEGTRVRKPDCPTMTTFAGHKVTGRQAVVLATGPPITKNLLDSALHVLAVHAKQVARRRYVVALRLPSGGAKAGVFMDTAEPRHTVRVAEAPGGGSVLLVAGEDHDQGRKPHEFPDAYGNLEGWARARWSQAGERVAQWSFPIYVTQERLPLVGPDALPKEGRYIATGDCGRIMMTGALAGMIITDQILGRRNPYAKLYSPRRKLSGLPLLPAWNPTYFKNTILAVSDMLRPMPFTPDVEDLAPDSGAIIAAKGIRKVAAYKDEQGNVHTFSGLCPHLGCLLEWNPIEKEWNCPCHGSCFSKTGTNVNGPTTLDMTPLPDYFKKS